MAIGYESSREISCLSIPLREETSLLHQQAPLSHFGIYPHFLAFPRLCAAFRHIISLSIVEMATRIDKEACREAYNLVRDDSSDICWWVTHWFTWFIWSIDAVWRVLAELATLFQLLESFKWNINRGCNWLVDCVVQHVGMGLVTQAKCQNVVCSLPRLHFGLIGCYLGFETHPPFDNS